MDENTLTAPSTEWRANLANLTDESLGRKLDLAEACGMTRHAQAIMREMAQRDRRDPWRDDA